MRPSLSITRLQWSTMPRQLWLVPRPSWLPRLGCLSQFIAKYSTSSSIFRFFKIVSVFIYRNSFWRAQVRFILQCVGTTAFHSDRLSAVSLAPTECGKLGKVDTWRAILIIFSSGGPGPSPLARPSASARGRTSKKKVVQKRVEKYFLCWSAFVMKYAVVCM